MISVGDVCVVRPTGSILWIVKGPALDPNDRARWTLVTKKTDKRGRSGYETRIAGIGDVTRIRDAPTWAVGDVIERNGLRHVVLRDLGDEGVELVAPEDRVPLRGGYTVHVAARNLTLVSKADLVLETFGKAL